MLIHLGPIALPGYPTLVQLGVLVGAVLVYLEARRRHVPLLPVLDVALAAAVAGLLVARATYVGLHWSYYRDHIGEALRPWRGGLAWQGALIGGVIGASLGCAWRDLRLTPMLDLLTPGAASLAAFAWLGCHAARCAYGIETYPGQGLLWRLSLDLPDLYGIREPRVPVQLLGAGWSALLLVGTLLVRRRLQRDGVTFALWLALHSLGSFGIGFWRADAMPQLVGWRVDQLVNLLLAGAAVVLTVAALMSPDSSGDQQA